METRQDSIARSRYEGADSGTTAWHVSGRGSVRPCSSETGPRSPNPARATSQASRHTSIQNAAKRAGSRTHALALRHTAVSLWIEDGAKPIDVQYMLGHSDVRMTLGRYGHPQSEQRRNHVDDQSAR
ncbi:MAG TPA: tyrosine-type recombinase/integrase [Actinomycetota bacterium]|nr:tyrosine-type recombinase/integrase [Actinomycetota bacterium]